MGSVFTQELIEKAKQAKSAGEISALAKEHGVEMSEGTAKAYFEKLNSSGEMSDEELDNVSGGGCDRFNECPSCGYPLDKINGHWVCRSCGREYNS